MPYFSVLPVWDNERVFIVRDHDSGESEGRVNSGSQTADSDTTPSRVTLPNATTSSTTSI